MGTKKLALAYNTISYGELVKSHLEGKSWVQIVPLTCLVLTVLLYIIHSISARAIPWAAQFHGPRNCIQEKAGANMLRKNVLPSITQGAGQLSKKAYQARV